MTDKNSDLPTPTIQPLRKFSPSLIWLVPLIAAIAGAVLVVRSFTSGGPSIKISFETAEGIEANKTEVKFKNVVVGKVRDLDMAEDRQHVIVSVDLRKEASELAVDDSRFWVVRPRADLGGISGLGTLVSGAYIGVDVGVSQEPRSEFVGLEIPPAVTHDQKGTRFVLGSNDLGSLNIGSPIYFRRIPVGRIVGFDLNPDGKGVTLQAFVDAPYDRFVTTTARFWNASGVNVSVDASGFKLNSESLITLLAGGIAFLPLNDREPGPPATAESRFALYTDQGAALAKPDGVVMPVRLRFFQSMRGLAIGAPIDFQGLELGKVKTIELSYDSEQKRFAATVFADLFPERLGRAYDQLRAPEGSTPPPPEVLFQHMIDRGLRAQLRTGNLITGQLYVALDFLPKSKSKPIKDANLRRPLEIPTEPGSLDQIQSQIVDIVAKINEIPFGEIGTNLRDTLKSADSLLKQVDQDIAPEARKTLEEAQRTIEAANRSLTSPDSPLQQNARQTMEQVDRAARSLRNLADYLQRHPESLIRGKPEGELPEPEKQAP